MLQACAERSGVPTGVLCNVAQEYQKCMAPLINLIVDDIVEVSLLESPGQECETSPTLEEEATLLDKEHEPLEAPEAAASLLECLEIPRPAEPMEQMNAPTTSAPLSSMSNPATTLSKKQRNHNEGLRPTQAQ